MSDNFYIKQDDEIPVIEAQLTDSQGNPIDLSNSTVTLHVAKPRGLGNVFSKEANVVDGENGVVHYVWEEGDTSETGRFRAEFTVEYINGDTETFPNSGYETIFIDPSLE